MMLRHAVTDNSTRLSKQCLFIDFISGIPNGKQPDGAPDGMW